MHATQLSLVPGGWARSSNWDSGESLQVALSAGRQWWRRWQGQLSTHCCGPVIPNKPLSKGQPEKPGSLRRERCTCPRGAGCVGWAHAVLGTGKCHPFPGHPAASVKQPQTGAQTLHSTVELGNLQTQMGVAGPCLDSVLPRVDSCFSVLPREM